MSDTGVAKWRSLSLPPEMVEPLLAVKERKIPYETQANRKRRERFIKVPGFWLEQLLKTRRTATLKLALHLLRKHFESYGKPFTLANGVLKACGVWPKEKWRALAELEQLCLVEVERRQRKSPIITVLLAGKAT
jgi:hypothetical protein